LFGRHVQVLWKSEAVMRGRIGRPEPGSTAVEACWSALERSPLVREGNGWRYGRRRFSNATVKRLIDEGLAIREGDTVGLPSDILIGPYAAAARGNTSGGRG